ncbi:hypothetical protein MMC25_001463 [Agyrium rufum]|nr:hypothetical protein [Agyrium rufum]
MRAVDIKNGAGPASALFINDQTPKPEAKGAQAIVRVKCFGLNRMDLMQREGKYPLPPQAPKTLGVEFSGTIEAEAADVEKGFKVGDEVFGLAYGGAYAEYIAVSTHMLIHKPKSLSWETAAGIPESRAHRETMFVRQTWITATQALYLIGEFTKGKSILWHAGASSVSIAGIQLSVANGASAVYATAGTDDKCDFCVKELGATKAYNYKTSNWREEILKETDGKGVDIIIDFIGPNYFTDNLEAAARDGRIVSLAVLSGVTFKGEFDMSVFFRKRLRFEGSGLRSRDEAYQGRLRDQLVEHALPKFVDRSFKVPIEKVFDWEDIKEAHDLMASNQTKGKIICRIG